MGTTLHRHRAALAVASVGALAVAGLATGPAAIAAGSDPGAATRMTTVARGLNNPRLVSITKRGVVYVAEAGKGGHGKCVQTDLGRQCVGLTGAVTRIGHGHARRVVRHLPSLAGKDGSAALGPADALVRGGHVVISVGAGIDLKQRRALGHDGRLLGSLLRTSLRHQAHRTRLADIVRFEWRHNPDNSKAHDSDPTGVTPAHHGFFMTDSGGNDLLRLNRHGAVRVRAVFHDRMVPAPPQLGLPPGTKIPMQAVPTSVVRGHHAWFVSQLTGFPFPMGAANIYRVRPGHRPTVWASGLTNVTDVAIHRGRVYAVQIADDGLLAAESGGGIPMGSLIRVHKGDNSTPDVVAGNLPAPYGVALRGSSAWVTTCAVCPGGGQVVRVPVH